jgi:hypothetical protein
MGQFIERIRCSGAAPIPKDVKQELDPAATVEGLRPYGNRRRRAALPRAQYRRGQNPEALTNDTLH